MQYVVIDGVRHQVFVWERIEFITSPRPTSADVVKSIEDITSAKNEYLSNVTKARGDSAMRVISAIGIDEANKIMNRSLTPLLVEYEKAKNWRPVAIGSSAIVQTK
jgi:hypothetical protein